MTRRTSRVIVKTDLRAGGDNGGGTSGGNTHSRL
jgi:hypothetical protein